MLKIKKTIFSLFVSLGMCILKGIMSGLTKRQKILRNHYKIYKKYLIQNEKFKLIGFNLKKGELPLWIDVFCLKRNQLYKFLQKKRIFCRYFWQPLNTLKGYKKSFSNFKNSKNLNKRLMWLPSSLNLKKKTY